LAEEQFSDRRFARFAGGWKIRVIDDLLCPSGRGGLAFGFGLRLFPGGFDEGVDGLQAVVGLIQPEFFTIPFCESSTAWPICSSFEASLRG
jgi:hypothetical protein